MTMIIIIIIVVERRRGIFYFLRFGMFSQLPDDFVNIHMLENHMEIKKKNKKGDGARNSCAIR